MLKSERFWLKVSCQSWPKASRDCRADVKKGRHVKEVSFRGFARNRTDAAAENHPFIHSY